jgi:hypothetical protein
VPETDAATQEEERRQVDWCMWAALLASAGQISDGASPLDTLATNLTPCLTSHIPGSDNVAGWVAKALAIQNGIQMIQQLNPGTTPDQALQQLEQRASYSPSTWSAWFTFAANEMPPA